MRHYGGDRFEVHSAGTHPSVVNETAIQVMKAIGIDISHHRSKSVKEFLGQHFDYIITVCDQAAESCPTFPGASKKLHWSFPDPFRGDGSAEKILEEFRKVRDGIHARFKAFALNGPSERP